MPTVAYLLCGPSLAGKSTFAREIERLADVAIVSADAINERRGLPFGAEGLPETVWAETLRLQLAELDAHLCAGRSIVVDDTLCYRWLRDRFRKSVTSMGATAQLLTMPVSRDEILCRHTAAVMCLSRQVLSLEHLVNHCDRFEWPGPDEQPVDVGTSERQANWLKATFG